MGLFKDAPTKGKWLHFRNLHNFTVGKGHFELGNENCVFECGEKWDVDRPNSQYYGQSPSNKVLWWALFMIKNLTFGDNCEVLALFEIIWVSFSFLFNFLKSIMCIVLNNQYNLFSFSERQHYKLFHALRDHQMSWTEFTKEFVYLFVYFWNLLGTFGNRREDLNLELNLS